VRRLLRFFLGSVLLASLSERGMFKWAVDGDCGTCPASFQSEKKYKTRVQSLSSIVTHDCRVVYAAVTIKAN